MAARTASKETLKEAGIAAQGRFPEDYLGYQLARASHLVTSNLHNQLEQFGVTVSTWRILTSVLERERTISEIGQLVLMKQSALSRALDRLESDGLIARKRVDTERRVVYVHLTPAGRKLAESLRATAALHEKGVRGVFSSGDLSQLGILLDRLISALSK
jgi:MarR family transcriptional regulator, organic hydroperoxide resistance regulator